MIFPSIYIYPYIIIIPYYPYMYTVIVYIITNIYISIYHIYIHIISIIYPIYPIYFSCYKQTQKMISGHGPGDATRLLRGASHLRQRGLQWLHRRATLRLWGGGWWPLASGGEKWGPKNGGVNHSFFGDLFMDFLKMMIDGFNIFNNFNHSLMGFKWDFMDVYVCMVDHYAMNVYMVINAE